MALWGSRARPASTGRCAAKSGRCACRSRLLVRARPCIAVPEQAPMKPGHGARTGCCGLRLSGHRGTRELLAWRGRHRESKCVRERERVSVGGGGELQACTAACAPALVCKVGMCVLDSRQRWGHFMNKLLINSVCVRTRACARTCMCVHVWAFMFVRLCLCINVFACTCACVLDTSRDRKCFAVACLCKVYSAQSATCGCSCSGFASHP